MTTLTLDDREAAILLDVLHNDQRGADPGTIDTEQREFCQRLAEEIESQIKARKPRVCETCGTRWIADPDSRCDCGGALVKEAT